ncbi:unnamed protein product [Closterium sp. NIES-64]|nr:unnamed protein product [Closterium sp. NIES-64]
MVEAEAQKESDAAAQQKEGAAPKMVEAEAQKESEAAARQKEEGAAPKMVEAEAQKESEAAARQKAEAEEQKQAAEEALQLARAEARKKAVVEARQKAEGEAQKMPEAEEQKQAEADGRRKPDGEEGSDGNKMIQTEGRETAGAEGHINAEEEGQHDEEAASQVFAYRETQSMAETERQNTMEEVRVVPEAGVGHYEGDALETEEEQNEEDTVHPAVRIFLGGSLTRGPGTGVERPWRVADDGAPRDTVDLNRQRRPTLHQRTVERNIGQGGVAEAFWQVEWVEAETAIRRMLHRTSTVLVEQGDRFVEAESWDISPAEVTRRLTLLARMVTQTFCNLATRNSSISRDVADLTVHYCRDALANLEEVRHGNEERRRQAETAARFREQVDTRLSNLRESIVRVSDQVRQSGEGVAEGTLKGVEERLREVLKEDSERRNRDRLQDKERRQKATRKEADAIERQNKEQQQEEERRQKEMREGMKEMKEAMMKEMKAEMKEMKDGMVNQIVGRLSAVLREESERQKKARQEDAERRQQQDAERKQVADNEERQKKKQLDGQWRKEEEEKRKDVEATERRRKKKHQEEERRQKEVEAGMKEVMEAMKEMKTRMKGWKEGTLSEVAACAGVGIIAWQKMVGGVEGENGYSTEEHAVGLAATLSVMWAASTNVDQTQWETGATTAARGTSTAIASSAARSSPAATASSAASSSSAADVSSAVLDALATLAASVACVAVEAMRSVKDQEHDKEAWILPLSDALLKALPAESRAAGDTKRMMRVVAKVVTSWCLCSMASRGLRQHQGVCLGVLQKKLGGRDTTTGADKEKKTKKSSAKKNTTKEASTEENTGAGGQE